jgi:hypothetical protein
LAHEAKKGSLVKELESTFINEQLNSTCDVQENIISYDKNKQLTLFSQRKLAITAINKLLHYIIIGAPKKFKKQPRF